jgi:hypothetical protein
MDLKAKPSPRTWLWLAIVLGSGLAARFWCGTLGRNYDFESYRIVTTIVEQGGNVYANTHRYNYGPVWFNVLHALDLLAAHNAFIFRWLLITLLSAADIGIFYVLWRKFGRLAATLFFLNPVSILITGYHNQFDNVAILLGLWAMLLFGDDFEKPLNRRKYSGLAVLGLSLMTKHIFFAFPFWLAVKQRGLFQKCLVLTLPVTIFIAGFLPCWSDGHAGIIQNVFEYQSAAGRNLYFYNLFLPGVVKLFAGPTLCWLLALVFFGFVCRTRKSLESLLIYTGVLVMASPTIANQYLAIPAAFVSVEVNPFSFYYTVFATLHIAAFNDGPQLIKTPASYDDIAVTFLFLAVVWMFWRQPIMHALKICRREISHQFRPKE